MPNRNQRYYHTNEHHLERAFSAPTPSGDSISTTLTADTPIKLSNMNKRDQNCGSNAPLLGHQTPHDDRRRGLGNDYVSDATLLTTTSTVGIINETKKPVRHKHGEETRPVSVQTAHSRKRLKNPVLHPEDQPSPYQLAFMVVGCLVFVFACFFGTIYLIIYRMKLLEYQ